MLTANNNPKCGAELKLICSDPFDAKQSIGIAGRMKMLVNIMVKTVAEYIKLDMMMSKSLKINNKEYRHFIKAYMRRCKAYRYLNKKGSGIC